MDTIIAALPYLMEGLKVTVIHLFLFNYLRVFDRVGNGFNAPDAY